MRNINKMDIRINSYIPITKVEGVGARFAIWVQGCSIRCEGCANLHMWNFEGGTSYKICEFIEIIKSYKDRIEGITWLGGEPTEQIQAVTEISKAHSGTDRIKFEFFSLRNHDKKLANIEPYLSDNCEINMSRFSGFVYKAVSTFIPLPYSWFFGKGSDITHFFNYIVPPFVHGKKVVTIHDMVYKAFPETVRGRTKFMLEMGLKKSMKRADIIVTDSEF